VEIIRANQLKLEKFGKEMEEKGKQATDNNQKKLDYMWSQLMTKVSYSFFKTFSLMNVKEQ
jgi:hypothetical protein